MKKYRQKYFGIITKNRIIVPKEPSVENFIPALKILEKYLDAAKSL